MAEVRCGALKAGWGELRRRRLERDLARFVAIKPDDHLIEICARLRHDCEARGHPLGQKVHETDRWIAATALVLEVGLVSDDGAFSNVDGLRVLSRA
jgi:predicted nucleic acid-binding protein